MNLWYVAMILNVLPSKMDKIKWDKTNNDNYSLNNILVRKI